MSRAEGETDQNAGKKNNKEGHWYVVEMNVAERKSTVRVDGGGRRLGRVESKRVHAAAAAAKAAARLAHEQATRGDAGRRAAEDDLGVWRKVHWQAENYSTVPAV